jgi:hypothetical protein
MHTLIAVYMFGVAYYPDNEFTRAYEKEKVITGYLKPT